MLIEVEDLIVYGKKQSGLWKRTVSHLKQCLWAGAETVPLLKGITGGFSYGINVILGPNGSGKSILLQVLDGLILPDGGRILIDGQVAKPSILRQNVGYLPQAFGFYPKMTAREMLDYIALLKGIVDRESRKHDIDKILQQMGLKEDADRKVGVYSRGMRQKVGIAQALLGNPPVLILDEPTAGLDPEARNILRGVLAELGGNRVIIWASSMIADTYCANRVLVLETGESRFWGKPSELADCGRFQKDKWLKTDKENWPAILEEGYRAVLLKQGKQ